MVYELNEKSTIQLKKPFQLNRKLRGELIGFQSTFQLIIDTPLDFN
jgi:hypothetical protein